MSGPWVSCPPLPPADPAPEPDADSAALSATVASLISLADSTEHRSLQSEIGASEIGWSCPRRAAYKLSGTPAVNRPDPLRAIVGTGLHLWLEHAFARLDGGSGRFVVEQYLSYHGIPGKADCYDRFLHVVLDWKSSTLKKIGDLKRHGIPEGHLIQANLYAAALIDAGEDVRKLAIVFIPIDGTLDQIWSFTATPDRTIADRAVARVDALRGKDPADVPARPDRLCGWCAAYSPTSTNLSIACPGKKET